MWVFVFFFLRIRPPPRSTRTYTLFPSTALVRSRVALARGVSPLEMASAYGFLSTGGTHTEARIVTRVVAPDGTVVLDREPEPEQAVGPAITGALRSMLQDVIDDGTGRAAQLRGWEPAGKTGTSQNNADAWFVGTVPTLSEIG